MLNKAQTFPPLRSWTDRSLELDGASFLARIDWGHVAQGDFHRRFIENPQARHFLDASAETAQLVQRIFPDNVRQTIAMADRICRREFSLLGRDVSFGSTIDWFWCPETGGSWPGKHADAFAKTEYYGEARMGDIKYPWELARHQYFFGLAKAWRYTGDDRYILELIAQWRDWIEKNPLRFGIHWISEMEFGIRILSWTNTLELVKHSPCFVESAFETVLRSLYEHALYLDKRLTTHWLVANNHLIGETAGLFAFGVLFPQFREAPRWRDRALAVFVDALDSQTFDDGVNREQSTGYHRFVLDFALTVMRLAELNGIPLPQRTLRRIQAMLEYESAIIPPGGLVPQIGDCDDGRGIVLAESIPFFDFRGWQAVAAWQFNNAEYARAAEGGNEEALWLLGASNWEQFRAMAPSTQPRKSRHFKLGGHCILRTGDSRSDSYVFVRCGEFGLGLDGSCVHSHADILSPVVFWRGKPLLVDLGTFAYYCKTEKRDQFRLTASHNTVAPRQVEQAVPHPIFNWGRVPISTIEHFECSPDESSVTGRIRVDGKFTHARSLRLRTSPLELVIEDEVSVIDPCEANVIDAYLHLAPGLSAECDTGRIRIHDNHELAAEVTVDGFTGTELSQSLISPSYGVLVPNIRIRLTADGRNARTRLTFR